LRAKLPIKKRTFSRLTTENRLPPGKCCQRNNCVTSLRCDNLAKSLPPQAIPPQAVLWRGIWAAALFHLAFALFELLLSHHSHWWPIANDLFETGGGLLAAALCFLGGWGRAEQAARSGAALSAREVWMPRLFGAGLACYAVGQGVYTFQDIALHHVSTDFHAYDIWYLASYPLLLAGVFLLPTQPLPLSSRPRMVLDALMSMAALVTFSWYFLLSPILVQKHVSTSAKFVALSYPTLDLVSIFCMLLLGQHAMPRLLRQIARVVSWGLVLTAASDTATGYQSLHGLPLGGSLMDLGWSLGYCAIALAVSAIRLFPDACRHADDNAPRTAVLWQSLLPYAFLPAVGMLILCLRHRGAEPGLALGVYAGASLLVVLVLLRQIVAIFENRDLNFRLTASYQESMENTGRMRLLNEELVSTQDKLHDNLMALTVANERLERLAETDAVSGLRNHRGMAAALEEAQAHRLSQSCALLFLDVDHFKALNDSFGHAAGDAALREVGLALREHLRSSDTLGRWGGEEFLALLPGADLAQALAAAEGVRAGIAARVFGIAGGLHLTCSIGVAALPQHAQDWMALVDAADQAMYDAKRGAATESAPRGLRAKKIRPRFLNPAVCLTQPCPRPPTANQSRASQPWRRTGAKQVPFTWPPNRP